MSKGKRNNSATEAVTAVTSREPLDSFLMERCRETIHRATLVRVISVGSGVNGAALGEWSKAVAYIVGKSRKKLPAVQKESRTRVSLSARI
jgi:hypothetical protein